MNVETIEVSKLLSECADWLDECSKMGLIGDERMKQYSAAIRSVIIPSPGAPDDTSK